MNHRINHISKCFLFRLAEKGGGGGSTKTAASLPDESGRETAASSGSEKTGGTSVVPFLGRGFWMGGRDWKRERERESAFPLYSRLLSPTNSFLWLHPLLRLLSLLWQRRDNRHPHLVHLSLLPSSFTITSSCDRHGCH